MISNTTSEPIKKTKIKTSTVIKYIDKPIVFYHLNIDAYFDLRKKNKPHLVSKSLLIWFSLSHIETCKHVSNNIVTNELLALELFAFIYVFPYGSTPICALRVDLSDYFVSATLQLNDFLIVNCIFKTKTTIVWDVALLAYQISANVKQMYVQIIYSRTDDRRVNVKRKK